MEYGEIFCIKGPYEVLVCDDGFFCEDSRRDIVTRIVVVVACSEDLDLVETVDSRPNLNDGVRVDPIL